MNPYIRKAVAIVVVSLAIAFAVTRITSAHADTKPLPCTPSSPDPCQSNK